MHFEEMKFETRDGEHAFEVQIKLAGIDPAAVRVELYADGRDGGNAVRQEMQDMRQPASQPNVSRYKAVMPASRPATDYTARVIPHHEGVTVPLEAAHIRWHGDP